MLRRTPRLWAMTAALVATAACNGDDGAAPTTVDATTTVETTVPDTTPPTTEPPPTTAEQTTTTTTTTVDETTTTTDPPPTTVAGTEEEQIARALSTYVDAANELLRNPGSAALRQAVGETATEDALDRVLTVADDYVARNRAFRPNPLQGSFVVPRPETLGFVGDDVASMEACVIDADLFVEVGGAPDGSDRVIDDTVDSLRFVYTLERRADRWIVIGLSLDQVFEESVGCA